MNCFYSLNRMNDREFFAYMLCQLMAVTSEAATFIPFYQKVTRSTKENVSQPVNHCTSQLGILVKLLMIYSFTY